MSFAAETAPAEVALLASLPFRRIRRKGLR